jgi:hypothetical protein
MTTKNELQDLNYCESTIELKSTIENSFLDLGQRLLKIRNENLYLPQWTSFLEYVWEMKMSEAQASKLINIYQKFVLEYAFPRERLLKAGGWSSLAEVLPMIKSKEDAEYWLEKTEILSRPDLRKEKKEHVTGIQQSDCEHHDTYELRICRTCGLKEKLLQSD